MRDNRGLSRIFWPLESSLPETLFLTTADNHLQPARRRAGRPETIPMPLVRRHRIGDQLPAVIHPDPDPAAFDLCGELAANTDAQAVILFGSRATGGWDEQSDLDLIIVHPAADDEDDRREGPRAGSGPSSGSDTTRATAITTAPIKEWRTG